MLAPVVSPPPFRFGSDVRLHDTQSMPKHSLPAAQVAEGASLESSQGRASWFGQRVHWRTGLGPERRFGMRCSCQCRS
jgi:hypothetical protein